MSGTLKFGVEGSEFNTNGIEAFAQESRALSVWHVASGVADGDAATTRAAERRRVRYAFVIDGVWASYPTNQVGWAADQY
jgi:type 1 glutamine amidotransferase